MSIANIKVIEGVFIDDEKREMIEKVADAIVSVADESLRDTTVVTIE